MVVTKFAAAARRRLNRFTMGANYNMYKSSEKSFEKIGVKCQNFVDKFGLADFAQIFTAETGVCGVFGYLRRAFNEFMIRHTKSPSYDGERGLKSII